MPKDYDFSGWATKFGVECSDGRTITRGAFEDNHGKTVPLVFNHTHDDISNVIGHADLELRPQGMYAYGYLNNTPNGNNAREQLRNGDIKYLSIYANRLTERGGSVLHGDIKEVSLVLAGANPEACIDVPYIEHSEYDTYDFEGIIYTGEPLELAHSEETKPEEEVVSHAEEDKKEEKGDKEPMSEKPQVQNNDDKTVEDVFNTLNEEQKKAVFYVISQVAGDDDEDDDEKEGESADMKHNVFDTDERTGNYLSQSDIDIIFRDAKRLGSLRDSVLAHEEDGVLAHADIEDDDMPAEMTATYGIDRMNFLFPEAKLVNNLPPEFIKRDMGWVEKVMGGTHHTPFSRIKSLFANITMDEARARGYLKGHLKKDEVFTLLRRTTDPQTIYKKQKMDRDDIVDITDFDVVSWLKSEMRMMLDEEIARAVLVGDGRNPADEDHISEEHIRPIWKDKELYSVKIPVTKGGDDMETAKNMIDASIRGRKEYKGSGQPTLFTTEDWIAEMLLLEDGINHKLYKSEAELATAMRVKEIVTVPVMEKLKDENGKELYGIIVNLKDYNVGADKGGAVNMFEDFDIDYNQQKYLIETRISGALIKPYSALVLQEA